MTIRPKIGGHVSAAGGLYKAIENATSIGAECIQIFGASPRQWFARIPSDDDVKKYRQALEKSSVGPVFLHAAYLVNLACEGELWKKSVESLRTHLKICDMIGAQGLIFHLGSCGEGSREKSIAHSIKGMKEVLKNVPGKTQLIMENSAGGGQKLGWQPDEIGLLYKGVASKRVKVCIDTAHIFESGVINEFTPASIKNMLDAFEKAVGIHTIVALHVNDSKTMSGSHSDRHENIGEGFIGLDGFKNLAAEKRLHDKSWILEVPGFDNKGPDKKNVEILRSCF